MEVTRAIRKDSGREDLCVCVSLCVCVCVTLSGNQTETKRSRRESSIPLLFSLLCSHTRTQLSTSAFLSNVNPTPTSSPPFSLYAAWAKVSIRYSGERWRAQLAALSVVSPSARRTHARMISMTHTHTYKHTYTHIAPHTWYPHMHSTDTHTTTHTHKPMHSFFPFFCLLQNIIPYLYPMSPTHTRARTHTHDAHSL